MPLQTLHRPPQRPRHPSARRPHGPGFWLIAAAFLVAMAFSAVPTPLYALYQRRDHFSAFTVSIVFAAYAVGVVVSLFLAGHLSDRLGRRTILIPALLLEVVAALVFLSAPTLGGLIAARLVTGLGIGMITATATAHLDELHAVARPGAHRARADLTSTAANLGGLGLGPLISGLLAQFAGSPLRTPYLVFAALLLACVLGVALAPETVEPGRARMPYRPQRVSVPGKPDPASSRRRPLPSPPSRSLPCSARWPRGSSRARCAPPLPGPGRSCRADGLRYGGRGPDPGGPGRGRCQLLVGMALCAAGLVPTSVALWIPSLPSSSPAARWPAPGRASSSKGRSPRPPNSRSATRGETLAGLFLAGYLGVAVPVLGMGVATLYVSSQVALLGFAAVMLALIGTVCRRLLA
ncbi:MFS transporter [Yinghuangia aomiensis]